MTETTARLERADELAAIVAARGVTATSDVANAAANLPCVLVTPPTLDFDLPVGATATWRLVCLAGMSAGARQAWVELDHLVDACALAFPGDVEKADPGSYSLPTGGDPLPAYIVTVTQAVD